jgi:hypothetical protein
MREQAVLCMENLKKTLEAAVRTFADLVSATRFLTDVEEQDDLNRVWAQYLGGHLPTDHDRRGEPARHARALQDRDQRDRGHGGVPDGRPPHSSVSAAWAAGWSSVC